MPKANTRKQKDRRLGAMLYATREALHDFYRPHNQILTGLLENEHFLWEDYKVSKTEINDRHSESSKSLLKRGGERGWRYKR
jgi:hypothetical protein